SPGTVRPDGGLIGSHRDFEKRILSFCNGSSQLPRGCTLHTLTNRMNPTSWESGLWLRAIEGVGDATLIKLVQTWNTPQSVCTAAVEELIGGGGCSRPLAAAIRKGPDTEARRKIEVEYTAIERHHVRMLSLLDPTYPARLKMISDPPPLLYVAGTLTDQ